MKYLFILLVLLVLFVIYKKLKTAQIEKPLLKEEEPKISFLKIEKNDDLIDDSNEQISEFEVKIDSVTKKKNTLEFLIKSSKEISFWLCVFVIINNLKMLGKFN